MGNIDYSLSQGEQEDTMNFFMRSCKENLPTLTLEAENAFCLEIPEWNIHRDTSKHMITRTFSFDTAQGAAEFANAINVIAEQEQHHPDITNQGQDILLSLYTHTVSSLTENDFIIAAKADMTYNLLAEKSRTE